ncbi:trk system potassium uptake protein TrkA [Salinibacter ruber]|jgi:trk system potassium uptake protein TrkA|uniref:Trk system potassium uptake protein TrkA n=3 Tax=Salinibacter ruber TaxID=146919 RepID=Q2S0B4_SALRD|nr:TrkA family potassium uptake protein [Salinibacter ruber]ABC43869.1 Trk potassium uptake system protein [Salinibacter ruber DSM 13855]MBB4068905.1 trk system potassium uptake protein TrkA [Salinibacter ruber]MBB4088499.1 trk system potassium uptake protein TrkA [Salinibacter ruber]MCS3662560.1 trk system potassium uptake protein TrkA [Salinibacter ruber]MCS3668433.1 trk system potassium uptake protein TrkA [Salinibacter ruber]
MSVSGKDLRIIIAGGGEVGFRTAEFLDERGHDVVVIERDPDRCQEIADEYVATIIEGDATLPEIFQQAGPEQADVLAAMSDHPLTNLAVCMIGQRMNPDLHTVMRTDAETGNAHAELVDAVIYPRRASALLAVNAILSGDVRSLEHAMGVLDIAEVRIGEDAPVVGKVLDEISLPEGSLVVSDVEGARVARADTVMKAGQRYIVAAEPDVIEEVMRLLRG